MPDAIKPTTDAEFAASFAAKLDADADVSPAPGAGHAPGATDDAEHEERDGAAPADAAAEHDAEDDAGEAEESDDAGADGEDADGTDDGADDGTEDDASGEEEDDASDENGENDDGEADDDAADGLAAQVRTALEQAGLKLSLKDLPAAARPLVQRKLDNAQAAITRVLQEAGAFRKEKATFLAEQRFRDEHPEMAIAEMLDKHPELFEKVNEIIDKNADADKKRLFERDLSDARAKALEGIQRAQAQHEGRLQRADQIETYVRRACDKLGLPVPVVEQAVALELLNKPEDTRDLTEQELDAVITRQQRVLKGVVRQKRLADAQSNIRERARDKKVTTPAVRTGSGAPHAMPTGKRAPKNDAEFTELMLSKLG